MVRNHGQARIRFALMLAAFALATGVFALAGQTSASANFLPGSDATTGATPMPPGFDPLAPDPAAWDCGWQTSGCLGPWSGWNAPGTGGNEDWGMDSRKTGQNCTSYVAYRLSLNGVEDFLPDSGRDADRWAGHVDTWNALNPDKFIVVDGTPAVGAVAVWDQYGSNHVAYVDFVAQDGSYILTSESGYNGDYSYGLEQRAVYQPSDTGTSSSTDRWPDRFIHPGDLEPSWEAQLDFTTTNPPTINGTSIEDGRSPVDSQVYAYTVAWGPAPDTMTYQWNRDGAPIAGAIDWRYTPSQADIGHDITVDVTGKLPGYKPTTRTSAELLITAESLEFAYLPVTLSGTPRVEHTLTSSTTLTTQDVTTTIEWLKDGQPWLTNLNTVPLNLPEIGHTIQVRYTFAKPGYETQSHTSGAVTVDGYFAYSFSSTPKVTISGTPKVDYTLTASTSMNTPGATTSSIQWFKDGEYRATGSTLLLTSDDIGKAITVQYTFNKYDQPGYQQESFSSSPVTVAGYSGFSFGGVAVSTSGTPQVEFTLTAGTTIQTPGPYTTSIQWLRNGASIYGATGTSYTLGSADIGTSISVRYTFAKQGHQTQSYTSSAVSIAGYSNFQFSGAAASISGTPRPGSTLTASTSVTSGPSSTTIRWYVAGVHVSTGNTYVVAASDIGKTIQVRYTFDKQGYYATTYSSSSVTAYTYFAFTGVPVSATGSATVGSTLTAYTTVTASGVTKTYQWYRNGIALTGATGSTRTLTTLDRGKSVTVRITLSKFGYVTASYTSAARTVT